MNENRNRYPFHNIPAYLTPREANFRCSRVLISEDGYTNTPDYAQFVLGIVPDFILRRRDGWTLGAPMKFWVAAVDLHREDWMAIQFRGKGWIPFHEGEKIA